MPQVTGCELFTMETSVQSEGSLCHICGGKFGSSLPFIHLIVHIFLSSLIKSNLDSTFGIVTKLHAGKQSGYGSILGRDKKYIFSPRHPDHISRPPSLIFNSYRRLFSLEVIWLRYGDHSTHSVLRLKWVEVSLHATKLNYTSTPLYASMAYTGITLLNH